GSIRRIVPAGSVDGKCLDAVVAQLPRWTRAAARIADWCLRHGDAAACLPLATPPPTPPAARRRLVRACGTASTAVCERLGCAGCATADDVVRCGAAAGAGLLPDVAQVVLASGTAPCSRALLHGV